MQIILSSIKDIGSSLIFWTLDARRTVGIFIEYKLRGYFISNLRTRLWLRLVVINALG